MFKVDVTLWLAEMLSFNRTSLTQNGTQKERLLKKYRLCSCSRTFQNGIMLLGLFVCVVTITIIAQWRPAYENVSFHYVMTGAESEQPVGAPFYQWVGCRDHAGLVCFCHSGSWQAQGGPVYLCRDQIKCVFHNMGPLK